ncbi:Cyclic di-GMP phosphodiesterase response regulator RpfG [Polystyrenella longa]|uniref:Cyclic di-GMP phosphodiesterase response regulator RpfG n=1 Tax=Polystyrenella longa TaxID=2528007 RepID=A0A518CK20_9PLAN|nr:HD domain-containing phosphohydrolase [Polystyrenella longa]QDU79576.1 Cyclic di-GMP phosphodiesterase response regulator RpfG [Polystyrenella longa]
MPNTTATRSDASSYLAKFPLADLRMGAMLFSPVFDATSAPPKLLLAAGTTLTESLVVQLKKKGIKEVRVAPQELMNLTTIESQVDHSVEEQENASRHFEARPKAKLEPKKSTNAFDSRKPGSRWGAVPESFIHKVPRMEAVQYDPVLASHIKRQFSQNLRVSEQIFHEINHSQINHSRTCHELIGGSFEHIQNDIDLFLNTNLTSRKFTGPWKQGYQSSMLAVAMGTILGLNQQELHELAMGCFLHDVGTMRLNPKLVQSSIPLSRLDQLELSKHPGYSMDILTKWPDMPGSSCLIAYQIHERCNGTGYPNGRTSPQIHYLSKIAAVADTYIELMSEKRDSEAGTLPYQAIEQILYQVRAGSFDREVVRALLYTVSIFPIGSLVELSDSRIGRVLRSNRENYLTPICESWWRDDPVNTKEIIDLSTRNDIFVVRAISESPIPTFPEEGPLSRGPIVREALPDNDELFGSANNHAHTSATMSFLDDELSSILDELDF